MTATEQSTRLPVSSGEARAFLFSDARTANSFSGQPVSDEELLEAWDLAKWPPTAANTQPLRVQFVRTPGGKARLLPLMAEGNRAKTQAAPVTAILAADVDFHEFSPTTFPMRPEMKDNFAAMGEARREELARFNAALQAGYFILAVRSVGLAAGPMAGFDTEGASAEFFPGGLQRAFLAVNIGHPGENAWFSRLPRLEHSQVVSWS